MKTSEYFNLDDSNHNSLKDSNINPLIDLVEKKNSMSLIRTRRFCTQVNITKIILNLYNYYHKN